VAGVLGGQFVSAGRLNALKDFGKIGRWPGNREVNACKIVFDSESGSGVESRANAERSGVEASTSR
jgi:hypothetical protein